MTWTLIHKLVLAARLYASPDDSVALETCWDPEFQVIDADYRAACVCSLESYRCQAQGWCDRDETAPYQAAEIPLPDPDTVVPGCEF